MSSGDSQPTRVLVVDDSALYRQAICNILREDPEIAVVGVAKNGLDALEKILELEPDLLTLDVQMPDLDGIETLREMNKRHLEPKAIMVSSFTSEGATVTTDALLEGAFDFILKPSGSNLEENRRQLRDALEAKIGAFRIWRGSRRGRLERRRAEVAPPVGAAAPAAARAPGITTRCQAVLIATSTGGPAALKQVLPELPDDLGVPVLIVQHMPARYTEALAGRLDQISELRVQEARHGLRAESGLALVAPGGRQMRLSKRQGGAIVQLSDDPPEHGCRPAADFTLRSAVKAFDGAALAVVLTGMGRDGFAGCELLKQHGGVVFAQDEDSATVYGMPKAVVEGGLADRVLPLDGVAHAITRHVKRGRA